MADGTFQFQPRWKEELVVSTAAGSFVLEMPMGRLSVYLPTESTWMRSAPSWAVSLWPILHAELAQYCADIDAQFFVEDSATVYAA